MSALIPLADSGFAFLEGVFPYSQGVVARPGFAIERARFASPVAVGDGFRRIADHLAAAGRPKSALCACELRSPKPFSFAGFADFNQAYVAVLQQWGLYHDGRNAVARSNVAPAIDPPAEPSFYAFSYTVPASTAAPSFVVAGSGEWPEGGRFPEDVVARDDVSPAGMAKKADWVLAMMDSRIKGLGVGWSRATATQLYTVQDIKPLMEKIQRHIQPGALTWYWCRPPIEGLEFEMDLRGISVERVLA